MGFLQILSSINWEEESYPDYADFIALPFFFLFFPTIRSLLDRFVFEKVARRLIFGRGHENLDCKVEERRKKIIKFKESAWKFLYFLSGAFLSLSVTYNEPWFTNTRYFWVGPGAQVWPDPKMKLKLKGVYMYAAGFYTYSIFALMFWETRRSDFGVSMFHHVATAVLIMLSYIFRFARVGSVVLALHDACDIFLELGKMSKYSGCEWLAVLSFLLFVASWVLLRLTYFPFWILRSTTYEFVLTLKLDKEKHKYDGPVYYYVFNTLLFSLLVLHIYWGVLIYRMLVKQIQSRGHIGDDVRSGLSGVSLAQDRSQLSLSYYSETCPEVEKIVRAEMECAVHEDPRNAASILRLHFHDCFVQGCDGSVLLDDTITLKGEKEASQNTNSLIGFELIDRIKNQLESECPETVSCADLLAIAARDAVILVGGPYWDVPVGRKDSKTASLESANAYIPTPDLSLAALITKFLDKGLTVEDLVALSGAHTIGMARCTNFRDRIYGDFELTSRFNPLSELYLGKLRSTCPVIGGDDNIAPMDYITPSLFDNAFFESLVMGDGLLNSDQELYSSLMGFQTSELVRKYAADPIAFFNQFSDSMVKLGNIINPEGGEVRTNCRFVNT